MAQQIEKVGVLGAGLMGHGIAQVAAQAGYAVVLREVDEATLQKGIGKIEKQLGRAVEKGKATQEDADALRARIQGTVDYGDLADCDLVIEAITESLPLKLEMWREVDGIVKPQAIFATNTSSLAVVRQAAVTRLLCPYMLDAIRAYEEGVGAVDEIDEAMKAGAAHPMGPLTLADFVGLDTLGSICGVLFDEVRERRFARPPAPR